MKLSALSRFLAYLSLLLTSVACGQKAEATPTLAPPVPFKTMAPTPTLTLLPEQTGIFPPTPTVLSYAVVQGDTLSSIAQHNGVPLEALLAANPGISPAALSVGTKLIIPAGNQIPGEPAPTPAPLPVRQARCWPETSGGLWCFALLQNTYTEPLENLSARFSLLDLSGKELASQVAYGLLDILPPGASMPLAAHFAPPVQMDAGVRIQVLTAIRLLPVDARYLPVRLENTLVSLEASGRTAKVSGRVLLTGTGTATTLWILVSAYDAAGNVVGMRRWESGSALTENAPVTFDFQVSGVGPAIARVEFLTEARP